VRDLCVFTTHTPVEAGHDKFSYPLVKQVLGEIIPFDVLRDLAGKDNLNMTMLALNLSKYINGLRKSTARSRSTCSRIHIHAITNGVHTFTWTCEEMANLFNKYIRDGPMSRNYSFAAATSRAEMWKRTVKQKKSC